MNDSIQTLNAWSEGWSGLMWAILWQSTLLVAVVALVAVLVRRAAPAMRYWLWQIVAIKLLLMPFWTFALPLPSLLPDVTGAFEPAAYEPYLSLAVDVPQITGEAPTTGEALVPLVPAAPADSVRLQPPAPPSALSQISWQSWLLAVWLAVVAIQISRVAWQRHRLAALLGDARAADDELVAQTDEASKRLGLRHPPTVVLTNTDVSPFVCGVFRPTLVMPRSLPDSLAPEQLQQVLLHELAHLKRRDLGWGWTVEAAQVFYFFHPLVHWVGYRLRLERELACDQMAMSASDRDPSTYAETLVRVVSHASEPGALKTAAAISAGIDDRNQAPVSNQSPC